jgi:tagaturonate reductase
MPLGIRTVREAIEDQRVRPWLESLLFEEIVPTLEGRVDGPRQFAGQTLERFANPFLEHKLSDIAVNHEIKLKTRLATTAAEFEEKFGRRPKLLGELLHGS